MADKRKPETVLWVRHGKGSAHKVEIFSAGQFSAPHRFLDKNGHPIPANNLAHYHRLRVDGVWFPAGRRTLFTKNQCTALIKKEIFS